MGKDKSKILVIDDEPGIREFLEIMLHKILLIKFSSIPDP